MLITNLIPIARRHRTAVLAGDRATREHRGGRLGQAQRREPPLRSSPLSQSNWEKRIVVPLEFLPVGQACPIGPPERSMVGHELMTDAVSSWQPALCAGGGALFNYTQLTDDVARDQVLAGSSQPCSASCPSCPGPMLTCGYSATGDMSGRC